MIEDLDLRLMFKAECEERLQKLEQGLLQLEKDPSLRDCLEEVFREAHSLKGTARMLDLKEMEKLAHHFESVLKKAKNENTELAVHVIERLYSAIDALTRLANAEVTGEDSGVNLDEVLEFLNSEFSVEVSPLPINNDESDKLEAKKVEVKEEITTETTSETINPAPITQTIETNLEKDTTLDKESHTTADKEYKIETIRVNTHKLDNLMTHASELAINKNRIGQRLSDIDNLFFLWEQWKKQEDLQLKEQYFHELETNLQNLRNQIYEDNTRFEYLSNEIEAGIRSIRLLPMSTVFKLFPRMVRDIAKQEHKNIELHISGEETVADKRIIEEIKDPLTHLIRNAIHHAIEIPEVRQATLKPTQGIIHLRAYQTPSNIMVEVEDDGCGIDLEKIKHYALQHKLYRKEELAAMSAQQIQSLIFEQGFSTSEYITDISGRGLGMSIVRTNIAKLKGNIEIESQKGHGTLMRLRFPMTITTTQVVIVELQTRFYAIPLDAVEIIRKVTFEQIFSVDGSDSLLQQETVVSVAHLANLLGLENNSQQQEWMCVIIHLNQKRLAILVDNLVDEQEVMLKSTGNILKNTPNISGITILGNGDVCIILNPFDLIKSSYQIAYSITEHTLATEKNTNGLILYAEDSITTRTQIKRILEKEGFEVVTAIDGLDAYEKLGSSQFDGIVSDVTMPNMTGLELTAKIRENSHYHDVPIILISAMDKTEDRRLGLELGANAYISKGAFDQSMLIETLKRLI